jgi:hypothetical protein
MMMMTMNVTMLFLDGQVHGGHGRDLGVSKRPALLGDGELVEVGFLVVVDPKIKVKVVIRAAVLRGREDGELVLI